MAGQVWCPQGKEREEACGQVSVCGFLDGHFPVAAPFAEACQPSGDHVCDGLGLVHACLAMLGAMCQYDPECPVHRHRPGTTCPAVYRKMRAAERHKQRRKAQIFIIIVNSVVIVFLLSTYLHPELLTAIGDWLAALWPAMFAPKP